CKSAHSGGGKPVLAESYDDIDWEKIKERREIWRKQIAEGNPPEFCKGCPSIQETDQPLDDDSIYFIDVNSFINCNSRCMYCDCWEDTTFKEHSLLPYFKDLFDKKLLKNSNYGYIMFAGGEPALMRDFEEIIELCIENGMQRYIVNSNGIKFSKGIERLLKETEANVFVSLDSGCEETFNKVKNVPCFDNVVENLKRYANAQQEGKSCLWSKFIIIPDYNDSEEEILKWYDLSLSLGIKAVVLDVEREWFKKNNREINPKIENLINIIKNRCEEDGIKLDWYESLKCLYGIH
ncbi:MAG: radical SAM protein, partial [bacterium]|nr:radical SAM protein [bacterium]